MAKAVMYARTLDRGFALVGGLPWGAPLKSDMEHFKEVTTAYCNMVMGWGTFASLPCKLRGRKNVVLSRDGSVPTALNGDTPDLVIQWQSSEGFLKADQRLVHEIGSMYVVIGGCDLIEAAVNSGVIERVFETVVKGDWPSDKKLKVFERSLVNYNQIDYNDCTYFERGVICS